MKKLASKQRQEQIQAIVALPDDQIDTSDIPELTQAQMGRAVRGQLYRPIKKPVTMRLDADVIEWLKEEGPGYQTKANQLLRGEMLRFFKRRKTAQRASGTQAKAQRKPARSR